MDHGNLLQFENHLQKMFLDNYKILENEDYDILSILISVHGRPRAEEYFQLWLDCFAEEQKTLLFK